MITKMEKDITINFASSQNKIYIYNHPEIYSLQ